MISKKKEWTTARSCLLMPCVQSAHLQEQKRKLRKQHKQTSRFKEGLKLAFHELLMEMQGRAFLLSSIYTEESLFLWLLPEILKWFWHMTVSVVMHECEERGPGGKDSRNSRNYAGKNSSTTHNFPQFFNYSPGELLHILDTQNLATHQFMQHSQDIIYRFIQCLC